MTLATAPAPRAWIALLNPLRSTAFALSFMEDRMRQVMVQVPASPIRWGQLAHSFKVQSSITACHHLSGVRVRPEAGRDCPRGKLEVRVDQVPVLKKPLRYFAQDRDPLLLPWKKTDHLFWAVEMLENQADGKQKLGYMLPFGTSVEVWVEVEPLQAPAKFQIEVLMSLYNAGKKEAKKL